MTFRSSTSTLPKYLKFFRDVWIKKSNLESYTFNAIGPYLSNNGVNYTNISRKMSLMNSTNINTFLKTNMNMNVAVLILITFFLFLPTAAFMLSRNLWPSLSTHEKRQQPRRRYLDEQQSSTMALYTVQGEIGKERQVWKEVVEGRCSEDSDEYEIQDMNEHRSNTVTHFCFLVHGFRGLSADLSYLRDVISETARKELCNRQTRQRRQQTSLKEKKCHDKFVVHSAVSNEYKTFDGVEKGGERLLQEILCVIRQEVQWQNDQKTELADNHDNVNEWIDVTLSVVGNSFGGLYCRYAIAKLAELSKLQSDSKRNIDSITSVTTTDIFKKNNAHQKHISTNQHDQKRQLNQNQDSFFIIDRNIRIHFNIFCTTATPHLGISGCTWIPLPRKAEIGMGYALGATGRDLFRITNIIKAMCTSTKFLKPLRAFRKRIAYANAYDTDFPVPLQTAAFLNHESTYPHHFTYCGYEYDSGGRIGNENSNTTSIDEGMEIMDGTKSAAGKLAGDKGNGSENVFVDATNGLVAAILHTPPVFEKEINTSTTAMPTSFPSSKSELQVNTFIDKQIGHSDMDNIDNDELLEMSRSLDQLGWKKVLIDFRGDTLMFPVRFPRIVNKWGTSLLSLLNSKKRLEEKEEKWKSIAEDAMSMPLNTEQSFQKQQKPILGSRDIVKIFSKSSDDDLHFPFSHDVLVARSRDRICKELFKGGRPVMDSLAKDIVNDILVASICS